MQMIEVATMAGGNNTLEIKRWLTIVAMGTVLPLLSVGATAQTYETPLAQPRWQRNFADGIHHVMMTDDGEQIVVGVGKLGGTQHPPGPPEVYITCLNQEGHPRWNFRVGEEGSGALLLGGTPDGKIIRSMVRATSGRDVRNVVVILDGSGTLRGEHEVPPGIIPAMSWGGEYLLYQKPGPEEELTCYTLAGEKLWTMSDVKPRLPDTNSIDAVTVVPTGAYVLLGSSVTQTIYHVGIDGQRIWELQLPGFWDLGGNTPWKVSPQGHWLFVTASSLSPQRVPRLSLVEDVAEALQPPHNPPLFIDMLALIHVANDASTGLKAAHPRLIWATTAGLVNTADIPFPVQRIYDADMSVVGSTEETGVLLVTADESGIHTYRFNGTSPAIPESQMVPASKVGGQPYNVRVSALPNGRFILVRRPEGDDTNRELCLLYDLEGHLRWQAMAPYSPDHKPVFARGGQLILHWSAKTICLFDVSDIVKNIGP